MADFDGSSPVTAEAVSGRVDSVGGITPPEAVAPDTTPPTVAVVSPPAGSVIVRTDPIVVDVTDVGGLRNVQITAYYPASGLHEVAWDGDRFSPFFRGSVRSGVASGYRFTMRRTGGWLASPTFRVTAIDTSGNEGV